MILPPDKNRLTTWSTERIEECMASAGPRANMAKSQKMWLYTGSPDGNGSIVNMLYAHIERLASDLFSPADLRFHMDFTHAYPKQILGQAEVASRVLTREFERRDIDIQFGESVPISLTHGCCILKLLDTAGGISLKIVMPWQFGVHREDVTELSEQEAVNERTLITPYALWRRISHLPNAIELFRRARQYAKRRMGGDEAETWFHQVLIAGTPPVVQTTAPYTTQPGGLVQVMSDPTGAMLAPTVQEELIEFNELNVWDDEHEDYTTIQMCAPDILVCPQYRLKNLFIPGHLPYGVVRPNSMPQYFWGRSELSDLQKLQNLLKDRLEDIKKIMSLQYDRIYAVVGGQGQADELRDQLHNSGIMSLEAGASIEDLTPEVPKEAFADIKEIFEFINQTSGYNNIMSGQGEAGVRAGNHAETLMRTAGSRLRDRALLVERQLGDLAAKAFEVLCAKEAKAYWTDEKGEESDFLLSQIPDDYRVMVDSHSSSPVYQQDHAQIAFALAKLQAIGGADLINLLPLPRRDILIQHLKEKEAAQAALIAAHPELLEHMGGKKR